MQSEHAVLKEQLTKLSSEHKDLAAYELLMDSFATKVVGILTVDFEITHLPQPSSSDRKWDSGALDVISSKIQSLKSLVLSNCVPRVEFDKLQIRLEAKLSQLDEMSREIQKLQSSLDGAEKELDQYKMSEMKNMATNRLIQLDKDNELEILRSRIIELEEKERFLMDEISQLEGQLAEAVSKNSSLATVLGRMEEKEAATEELLAEIQSKCKMLLDENDELHQELHDMQERLATASTTDDVNHAEEVRQLKESYESRSEEFRHIIDQQARLLTEANCLNSQLQDDLLAFKQRCKEMELELLDIRRSSSDLESLSPSLQVTASKLLAMNKRMEMFYRDGMDATLRHLEMKISSAEGCVQDLRLALSSKDSFTNDEVKHRMIETQKALARALEQHDEDIAERDALVNTIRDLEDEIAGLRSGQVADSEADAKIQEQEDAIIRLKRLLVAAERRVSSAAADQAQKFAQSARIIGYLESECFRLHGLCDYFKASNAKLTGELKKALTNSIRQNHSENIALTLMEQKEDLEDKVDSLQSTLSNVRREHAHDMQRVEEEYRTQLMKLNSDLESMFTQLAMKETEMAEISAAYRSSQGQYTDIEKTLREENATLKASFTESEKRRIMQARELSEKDTELNELLAKLREASMQLTQLDERQKLLINDSEVKKALEEQCKSDLQHELQEAKARLVDFESKIAIVSAKLNSREEMLVKKEAEVADHVLRSSMLADENSNLIEEIKLLKEQVAVAVRDRDERAVEVETCQQKLQKIEQANAKLTNALATSEKLCQDKDGELHELREEIEKLSTSLNALEMRDKFNNDEISNAGQIMVELRLEVEALRTLVDDESSRRQEAEAALEDHRSTVKKLNEKLLQLQAECDDSDAKLKKIKLDLRSVSEKLGTSNDALERWSTIRGRVVDILRDSLVAWEGLGKGEISTATISRLRETLPQLLSDEDTSAWTEFFGDSKELVVGALSTYKNKVEEMEILLHGAHLQHVAVEESLKATQAELRVLSEVQLRFQSLEESSKTLQVSYEQVRRELGNMSDAQEFLFQRVVAAKQRLSQLSMDAGLPLPAAVGATGSITLDSFHREMGEFEDSIVSLITFLEGKSSDMQYAVRDMEDSHRDTIEKLHAALSRQDTEISELTRKLDASSSENNSLKATLDDSTRLAEALEAENQEIRESADKLSATIEDLQSQLNHADAVISELTNERDDLLRLTSNNDHDVRALETELDLFRKRIKSCELQLEATSSSNQRLKAERDALESLNVSMKMELERIRSENSSLVSAKALTESLPHLMVEFDRLIIAAENLVSSESLDVIPFNTEHETTLVVKIQNYSSKVTRLIAALGKLTLQLREDKKKLKGHEDLVARLKSETTAQKDLIAQLNVDVRQKNEELSALLAQAKNNHEVEKLENSLRTLEKELKESKLQLGESNKLLDTQQKSSSRLQLEVAAKSDEIASLRRQLQAVKTTLQMESSQREAEANKNVRALEEIDSLMLQLDASRQNCEKMASSVKHLEASLAHEKSLRHASEAKAAEMQASYTRYQSVEFVMQSNQREKESLQTVNQSLSEANSQLEEKQKMLQSELDLSRRRVQSLETRLQSVLSDRDNFLQKISETQAKLHQANMLSVRERPAPVEKAQEPVKTETALVVSADYSRELKNTIDQLNTELEEKEAKLSYEKKKRAAVEREMEAMKVAQSKLQEDCDKLKSYSVAFRSEGREARKDVLEISGAVCEMIVHMRMDLQLSPATKKIFSIEEVDSRVDADHLKLSEALGIQELLASVKSLRETYGQLRDQWRRLRQKEDEASLQELELSRLRRHVDEMEASKSLIVSKHSEDVRYWQQKYSELQVVSSSSQQLKKRVSDLEKILAHEQNLKEKAIAELDVLREQIDKLQSSANASRSQALRVSDEDVADLHRLQKEVTLLQSKLAMATEGNVALQATVEHLEDRLLQHQGAEDGANKLHQSDIIIDIYRTMLFSFIGGVGVSSGSNMVHAQYEAVFQSVESMVQALRKFYDEEVDFLNGKLNTIFHQYREAKVYGGELNRQMEDQVKALFRSGKSSVSEFMMKERDKLKFEVEKVQQELLETEQQLLEDQEKMRAKISKMAQDVVHVVKDRDEVAAALLAMENYCSSRGVDMSAISSYQVRHFLRATDLFICFNADLPRLPTEIDREVLARF